MPAYNAVSFLTEAVESVLRQTYTDFRLLIVDDGSTDGTLALARSFAERDSRVDVVTHANAGTAPTINRGISLVSGEWVFLMHADDVMRPDRIERQLTFLHEHPDLVVASSLVRHIDGAGRVIGKDNSRLTTPEAVEACVRRNELLGFNHPAVVLRKSAVEAAGGYRQDYWPAEDLDLWNRLVERGGKILVQPEFLLDYRIHGKSASISRAQLTQRKVRWLRDSMLRRRRGDPEQTWEVFLTTMKSRPIHERLNQARQDFARTMYKAGVAHYAERRYLQTFGHVFAAVVLRPKVMLHEVSSKLNLLPRRL